MPIYEYKCADCGARLERMQKVSEEPLTVCEACGGKLEKQWSLSGIQFKGAGWYVSDYSDKLKDPNAAKTDKEKTEKTEKSGNAEKTSAAESTAAPPSASNKANDTAAASTSTVSPKKETVSKKD